MGEEDEPSGPSGAADALDAPEGEVQVVVRRRRRGAQDRQGRRMDAEGVTGEDGAFITTAIDGDGVRREFRSAKAVLATGYYDVPNLLNVPGEDLPKVIHYYKEPHPYYNHEVTLAQAGYKNLAYDGVVEIPGNGLGLFAMQIGRAHV